MNIKEEKIKIILQYLRQQKFTQTFNTLQQQSQISLDPLNLQYITQSTYNNDFIQLEQILSQFVDNQTKNQCMLILLEQQYIKLIKQNQLEHATQILRNQICKYCQDEQNKHVYSAMLFSSELKLKEEELIINEILQLCYKQIGLIEPNRLNTLIQQSQTNQIINCKWHNYQNQYNNNNIQSIFILQNHQCQQQFKYIYQKLQVQFCIFSQNGQYQALALKLDNLDNFDIIINQQKNNQYELLIKFHQNNITQILFSPCGQYFGCSSKDIVYIQNLNSKKNFTLGKQHSSTICSFDFFNDPNKNKKSKFEYNIYTISDDGWLYLWDECEKKSGLKIEEKLQKIHCNQYNQQMIIVSKNKLSVYELYTRNQIREKTIQESILNSNIDSKFKFIIIYINENFPQLLLFSIDTLQIIKSFYNVAGQTSLMKFDIGWYGDNLIAAGTEQGELLIWHIQKSSLPIQSYQISEQQICSLKFNQINNLLYIYSAQQQQQIKRKKSEEVQQQRQRLGNLRDREIGGVQQILSLLQRIARSNPMMGSGTRMQNEDQQSSDEDL